MRRITFQRAHIAIEFFLLSILLSAQTSCSVFVTVENHCGVLFLNHCRVDAFHLFFKHKCH